MQDRLLQDFEAQLTRPTRSIHQKGCTKRCDKVLERIGRLKEKYKPIARFYRIEVEERCGQAAASPGSICRKRPINASPAPIFCGRSGLTCPKRRCGRST